MRPTKFLPLVFLTVPFALVGCSSGPGTGLTTSSVAKPQTVTGKRVVDPACMTLMAKINAARQEGTPARVHAVATGKTKTVRVKRTSLAKVAELDRLNTEFQMKCSKYPGIQSASIAAPTSTRPVSTAQRAVATAKTVKRTAKVVRQASTVATTPIVAVPKQ